MRCQIQTRRHPSNPPITKGEDLLYLPTDGRSATCAVGGLGLYAMTIHRYVRTDLEKKQKLALRLEIYKPHLFYLSLVDPLRSVSLSLSLSSPYFIEQTETQLLCCLP